MERVRKLRRQEKYGGHCIVKFGHRHTCDKKETNWLDKLRFEMNEGEETCSKIRVIHDRIKQL